MKKNIFKRSISKWTSILGLILCILVYIPTPLMYILPNGSDKIGYISVYVIPILGIIGCIFSIYEKKWLYLIFNLILALSFYIYFFLLFSVGR